MAKKYQGRCFRAPRLDNGLEQEASDEIAISCILKQVLEVLSIQDACTKKRKTGNQGSESGSAKIAWQSRRLASISLSKYRRPHKYVKPVKLSSHWRSHWSLLDSSLGKGNDNMYRAIINIIVPRKNMPHSHFIILSRCSLMIRACKVPENYQKTLHMSGKY